MLILLARVICAMSSDTRCATGSDWLSHGQEAVAAVVLAVPPAWAAAPEAGAASAATGSASAATAVTTLNNQRFLTPENDFTTPPITAQQSHDIVSSSSTPPG